MVLVDTSAWIEWLVGSETGKAVGALLPPQDDWLTPTIVQLELAKWLVREQGDDQADRVIAFSQLCRVVPLDTATALSAADICARHGLATADAVIYATAQAHVAELLTCDAHFQGLGGVRYLPKR